MSLFAHLAVEPTHQVVYLGAVLMRGLALEEDAKLFAALERVMEADPLRPAATPTGLPMQVLVTGCGARRSSPNRWNATESPRPKPPMPDELLQFAVQAAMRAGFPRFRPDACHVNRYQAGVKLGLHQDRHECDLDEPIVSVSLGLECVFQLGGIERTDPIKRILLEHGDVIVWGGPSRLRYHGVLPLKPGSHPLTGPYRYNMTFRKVN